MDIQQSSMCSNCLRRRTGMVISVPSNDYPHLIFCGLNQPYYLFPRSLYFVDNRTYLSKAQKAKFNNCLMTGEQIEFLANKNEVVFAYHKTPRSEIKVRYEETKVKIQDFVVISPEYPRKCWSVWLSRCIHSSIGLMNAVPDIVYEAFISMEAYVEEADESYFPRRHIIMELGEILKPVPNNSRVDDVYRAEWNLPDKRGLMQASIEPPKSDSAEIIKEPTRIRPKPPKSFVVGAFLYVLDNRQLVWSNRPCHKVVMGLLSTENEKKLLVEGKNLKADMFYCKFNEFYVVHRYCIISPNSSSYSRHPPLKARQNIDPTEFAGHTEYYVELTFSKYRGFYVSHDLKNCLIDDPKLLIFNSSLVDGRIKFPAWIRLNEYGKVARFSVVVVDEDYLQLESRQTPMLESSGFIVNVCTGSLFCKEYPTLRIFVMSPDRADLQVGEQINFKAAYFSPEDAFMIFHWSQVKNTFLVETTCSHRGFLFKEKLNCTTVKACKHLYEGENFGLVTDLEELIWTKARAENINMPESVKVYVVENYDKYRATFFNVYALQFETRDKDLALIAPTQCPPTKKWWESTDRTICNSGVLKEICEETCQLKGSAMIFDDFNEYICEKIDEIAAIC